MSKAQGCSTAGLVCPSAERDIGHWTGLWAELCTSKKRTSGCRSGMSSFDLAVEGCKKSYDRKPWSKPTSKPRLRGCRLAHNFCSFPWHRRSDACDWSIPAMVSADGRTVMGFRACLSQRVCSAWFLCYGATSTKQSHEARSAAGCDWRGLKHGWFGVHLECRAGVWTEVVSHCTRCECAAVCVDRRQAQTKANRELGEKGKRGW